MGEVYNLEKLADKIYRKGVEKAEKESQVILEDARTEQKKILDQANSQAKAILNKALQDAEKLKTSTENEVQLKAKQMLSDLQHEIEHLISIEALENSTDKAFVDVSFMQSMIFETIKAWSTSENLEVVIPDGIKTKLDHTFEHTIKNNLDNLTITFSDKLKDGFRIMHKTDSYHISFTKDEFMALFSSYLTEKVRQLLFSPAS